MRLLIPLLLLVILLARSNSLSCQEPILDTNKLWYTTIYQWDPRIINTEVLKLGSLVSINDTNYYTVLRSINGNEDPDTEYGFIRSEGGNVFYRESNASTERLFYDFTIESGDTITVYGIQRISDDGYEKSKMKLDSIKEISYYGIVRKTYYFRIETLGYWDSVERWYEGLGSEYGLLHHTTGLLGPDGHDLRCVYQNGELIYKRHPDIECIILENIDKVESFQANESAIYPNPVHFNQSFRIKLKDPITTYLEIYDITGRKVREMIISQNEIYNSSDIFPCRGVFFFNIKTEQPEKITGKIIVL